jgi:CDP-diacylglycerol--glycerol-3-phosphate 3-phosphatidyltransferase
MPELWATANKKFQEATFDRSVPTALRRRVVGEALGHVVAATLFMVYIESRGAPVLLSAAMVPCAIVLAAIHGRLWCNLHHNRRPGTPVIRHRIGGANRLTLTRGLLIGLVAGFLFSGPLGQYPHAAAWAWWPGVLYLWAALLDGFDGYWARRYGAPTCLGQKLDLHTDALGMLVACTVAVGTQRLPPYYLAAGMAFYVYRFGLWYRRRRGYRNRPTGPRTFARLVAGAQMGFVGIAMLPLFAYNVIQVLAPLFLLPLFAGFVWDWMIVRGGVSEAAERRCQRVLGIIVAKAPPLLRVGLLFTGGFLIRGMTVAPPLPTALLISLGLMVISGLAGRTAAFLLSLALAFQATATAPTPLLMATLATAVVLAMAGTGDVSLWRPEDRFIFRQSAGRLSCG